MKASVVVIHIIKTCTPTPQCLLIRHAANSYMELGKWSQEKINPEEATVAAAFRELYEETGIIPDRFYKADFVETFFSTYSDTICFAPVFVAFIDEEKPVMLSPTEHDAYMWIPIHDALPYLEFKAQRDALLHIEQEFVQKKPNSYFLIEPNEIIYNKN